MHQCKIELEAPTCDVYQASVRLTLASTTVVNFGFGHDIN